MTNPTCYQAGPFRTGSSLLQRQRRPLLLPVLLPPLLPRPPPPPPRRKAGIPHGQEGEEGPVPEGGRVQHGLEEDGGGGGRRHGRGGGGEGVRESGESEILLSIRRVTQVLCIPIKSKKNLWDLPYSPPFPASRFTTTTAT